jgi:hypothetical protein
MKIFTMIALLTLALLPVGDAATGLLSEPGALVDVFAFENGSVLVATLYSNDLVLTYLNTENTTLGTTSMFVPFDYDSIAVEVCGGYAQMLVSASWDGETRTWRHVWELPEQVHEHYLPVLCQ